MGDLCLTPSLLCNGTRAKFSPLVDEVDRVLDGWHGDNRQDGPKDLPTLISPVNSWIKWIGIARTLVRSHRPQEHPSERLVGYIDPLLPLIEVVTILISLFRRLLHPMLEPLPAAVGKMCTAALHLTNFR